MHFDQVLLVKQSFALVQPATDALAERFYNRLFVLDPALRALFHGDMVAQRRKLMDMLASIVGNLDRPQNIVTAVYALGLRHVDYGVEPEHYRLVGDALLWALDAELGERWTSELSSAWQAAYTLIAMTMEAASSPIVAVDDRDE